MSKLYVQLVQDHVHLHQMLEVLRCELTSYDQEDWHQPHLPLILQALDYIRVYPEVFHHPLEEHVFDFLLEQDLVEREIVARLVSQHDEMEGATDYLQEQFNELADNVSAPFDDLGQLAEYEIEFVALRDVVVVGVAAHDVAGNLVAGAGDAESVAGSIQHLVVHDPVSGAGDMNLGKCIGSAEVAGHHAVVGCDNCLCICTDERAV